MRALKFELKNTKMNTGWSFEVNGTDIGEHIKRLIESGEFIGTITVNITQTGEVPSEETIDEETTKL